jgi:hypothetical protein
MRGGGIPACHCRKNLRYKGVQNERNSQSLLNLMGNPGICGRLPRFKCLTTPDQMSSTFTVVDKERTLLSLKENGKQATFYMQCSTCDNNIEVRFLRNFTFLMSCQGCWGSGVTSIQYFQKYFDPANPEVPAYRAAQGSHTYCRIYHPYITDAGMKAAANIMAPRTYEAYKAIFPTEGTTSPSHTPLNGFWCRVCHGEDKPTDEDNLLSTNLANLGAGFGIRCKCSRSRMETIGEAILKSRPDFIDVDGETDIETKSERQQKLDHTCIYNKEYQTVFEWDGLQHFSDNARFKTDFKYQTEMDQNKVDAIHDGTLVRGRRVKFFLRMAYPNKTTMLGLHIQVKIQRLLEHFKSEVKKLSKEQLQDNRVIFVCLPEDDNKYTPLGLPKHENSWDAAL